MPIFILLLFSLNAFARGGGGHTASSGGGFSSHSSYGGGNYAGSNYGGSPFFFIGSSPGELFFVILVLLILFFWVSYARVRRTQGEESYDADALMARRSNEDLESLDPELIRQFDSKFSIPAFTDFVYALYANVHTARGLGKLESLSAFLSPEAIASFQSLSPSAKAVKGILVSGIHLTGNESGNDFLQISVHFQGNYTESVPGTPDHSFYAEETWLLSKKKNVPSLIPSKLRQIACPNCGAPPLFSEDGKCSACGTLIARGEFNWSVEQVNLHRHQTAPLLTSTVEEEGNDLPTVFAPNLVQKEIAFAAKHPEFKLSQLGKRAEEIYFAVQKAWTERKPELVRPYESENIFQMHQYWINEYLKQGLVNVLKEIRLSKTEAVKVDQDEFFESITLRMYGSMIDYTEAQSTHEIVSGNVHDPREFTEYWTFLRNSDGASAKKHEEGCPACGAPLKINQAGHCEYCQALVTSGDFDWVLSSIEQDENYQG